MSHPLVSQLRFTRHEWQRALRDVEEADGRIRLEPMNSISWIVGHLAWQEQRYWLRFAQDVVLIPQLDDLVGYGRPASTPSLQDMRAAWREITTAADAYLDTVTGETLAGHFSWKGKPVRESVGTLMLRATYHYWFHTGEILAIRQLLGHRELPEFVGDIEAKGPYRPE